MANEKVLTPPPVPLTDKERAEQQARQKAPVPTTGMPKTPREALEMERKDRKNPPVFVEASLPGDFDEPFKVAEPRELTEPEKEAKAEKDKLVAQVSEILKKYDHRESDIPPGHEYWALVARIRSL